MEPAGKNELIISDVTLGYGRVPVIRHFSLPPLRRGSLTALIGPNAAGKSTLLRGLAGLGDITGSVRLDGQELIGRPRAERAARLGYMPQTLPSGIGLSVLETVVGALRASPPANTRTESPSAAPIQRAYEALAEIGIAELANRSLSALSGGQRQMASLAQVVVRRPEVLLLDEPTSALDLRYQALVMKQAVRLARQHGMIVLIVLHDIALAAQYADQIAILHQGALHDFGTPANVVTSAMLAAVYEVEARVEHCTKGTLQIIVDQAE